MSAVMQPKSESSPWCKVKDQWIIVEGEKNKSFKSYLKRTDIHHENTNIRKWDLERQINGFQNDVRHDAWVTRRFFSGWKMFSLAPICHLFSQSLSIIRSIIVWSHQVKEAFSFPEGSSSKDLNLLGEKKKEVSVCGNMERNKGKGKGSYYGQGGVCIWLPSFIAWAHRAQVQLFSTRYQ